MNLEHPDQLAEMVGRVTALRAEAGMDPAAPYDFVAEVPPGTDAAPYAAAGATWCLVGFSAGDVSVDQVRGAIREGPYRSVTLPDR
jgi:hypothetical protein